MSDEMISKKQLLDLTGISYGQLYRWKRKGLIPEDWFVRKSTYTGQETFFPRSQILPRISKIINMKEDASLDDLADIFSPEPGDIALSPDEVFKMDIIPRDILNLYLQDRPDSKLFTFDDLLAAYLFSTALASGDLSQGEAATMLDVYFTGAIKLGSKPAELLLLRKTGVFFCLAMAQVCVAMADRDAKLIRKINIDEVTEELKLKLS